MAQVIPLRPEPILRVQGDAKNDCERNAAHIREIRKPGYHFILGVKEGDHAHLFEPVAFARQAERTTEYEVRQGKTVHRFSFVNGVPLNQSNPDLLVNLVEYWDIRPDQTQHFSWVTDFTVTQLNVMTIMQGGRARWKVENETFNTLKNQDDHFEHHYGHGQNNLSVVLAVLMMLAFLVDQVQQLADALFQAVLKKEKRLIRLWEQLRALFQTLAFKSMEELFHAILSGYTAQVKIGASP